MPHGDPRPIHEGRPEQEGNHSLASILFSSFPSIPFLRSFLVPGTGDIEMKRPLEGHGQVGEVLRCVTGAGIETG